MEWKIVVPVLCLIGILHVPGNAAETNSTNGTTNSTNRITVYRFNLTFSINTTFQAEYSIINSSLATDLKKNITSEVEVLYKNKYENFEGFEIFRFRNGSVVTEGELKFFNGSKPNVTDLTQILNNGSFSFAFLNNSTSISEVTAPATTPAPTPTPTPTPTVSAKVAKINLVFKILTPFKDIYANLSNPETVELTNNITSAFNPIYRKRFPQFLKMIIQKFSNGSIVTDSILTFDTTNGSSPNTTDVKDTLIKAIADGNFSFPVDNSSITVAVVSDPIAAGLIDFNITFKMNEVFTSNHSNMQSNVATTLANNITTQLNGLYKAFKNFNRTLVWRFRNGSIVVDGLIGFNQNDSLPSAFLLAKALADAVRNGTINLTIDPATINVTDPSGVSANRSPVLASMLTAVWMTLASLLLSAVMH